VELLTVELRERGIDALIHHGSLDVAIRRATEERFQQPGPKAIVATSTLELGIDIGDLELVIQVGPPSTVTSLLQRVGRSGRRFGSLSVGILYATQEDELPIVLAAGELALKNVVEPLDPETGAIHVAFHQAINLIRERDAVRRDELILLLGSSGSFADISREEWDDLVDELVGDELLDDERGRLRIGPQAERRVGFANYRDFYSVFSTDDAWTVRNGEETIGTLDLRFPVSDGHDVYFVLAGRRWKVDAVDRSRLVLHVSPATAGPIPTWTSGGAESSYEIMQRTCEILAGKTGALETPALTGKLRVLRADAAALGIAPGRIVVHGDQHGYIHASTYLGTETNEYLAMLLRCALDIYRCPQTARKLW
jgi:ATP-dependent Lhr-like helicase